MIQCMAGSLPVLVLLDNYSHCPKHTVIWSLPWHRATATLEIIRNNHIKWYQVQLFWAFTLVASGIKPSVTFTDNEKQVSGVLQGRSALLSSGYSALAGECLILSTNRQISVYLENCNHYHNCCLFVCLLSPSIYKSSANTQFDSLLCTQKDFFLSGA